MHTLLKQYTTFALAFSRYFMYIINHSCRTEPEFLQELILWIHQYFGTQGLDYRISRLLAPSDAENGEIVIIQQFIERKVNNPKDLLEEHQELFQEALFEKFNTNVLAFLTLMELLEKDEKSSI